MSRIAKNPIKITKDTECSFNNGVFSAKGKLGQMEIKINSNFDVNINEDEVRVSPIKHSNNDPNWGTTRAIVANTINGVTNGFEKKLSLVGVGYKAQAKGSILNLALGFSHPVNYEIPKELKATTPSATEIIISGADKQKVGQVAAEIRSYRPPEPYKGKGVKYKDEFIFRKEGKKK